MRNQIVQQYTHVVRTTPQVIVEIASNKQRMTSTYSPLKLANEYNQHIRHAEGTTSDEITESAVVMAMPVWSTRDSEIFANCKAASA